VRLATACSYPVVVFKMLFLNAVFLTGFLTQSHCPILGLEQRGIHGGRERV
jgi:hypothetical protein